MIFLGLLGSCGDCNHIDDGHRKIRGDEQTITGKLM